MTDRYVWSSGSNTSPYNSWTTAATALTTAVTASVAGDTIYVGDTHAEIVASVGYACPSGLGLRIIGSNTHATVPPTGVSTTALISGGSSNNVQIQVTGSVYIYGLKFQTGTTGGGAGIYLSNNNAASNLVLEGCTFTLVSGVGSGCFFALGGGTGGGGSVHSVVLKNCTFNPSSSGHLIYCATGLIWITGMTLTGTAPTTLFMTGPFNTAGVILVENSDLSGVTFTNLVDISAAFPAYYTFRNCKLPSGVTIASGTSSGPGGPRVRLHNCDSGNSHIRFGDYSATGSAVHETTLVRSGGAQDADGSTNYSMKMIGSSSASVPYPLVSPEFSVRQNITGSSHTATVEILHDGLTALQNNQIWLELSYLGTTGYPQGSVVSSGLANVLATPANIASSSATWTTTGMTNPNAQHLQVTFTPQVPGYLLARVMSATTTTVYVDPVITVT